MNFQELQRHIECSDVLNVERQLASESPSMVSSEDLEKLITLLLDADDPNVAMEVVRWLEATDLHDCAAALVRVLVCGPDSASFWLKALINRMANIEAGQAALKEVLCGLSQDDLLRASSRHERVRQLATR